MRETLVTADVNGQFYHVLQKRRCRSHLTSSLLQEGQLLCLPSLIKRRIVTNPHTRKTRNGNGAAEVTVLLFTVIWNTHRSQVSRSAYCQYMYLLPRAKAKQPQNCIFARSILTIDRMSTSMLSRKFSFTPFYLRTVGQCSTVQH